MLARLLVTAVLLLAVGGGCLLWRRWLAHRIARLAEADLPEPIRRRVPPGRPAVLYFTSDGCVQCRLQQAPVLERFAAATGIPIYPVDAVAQSDLADYYGVMTVPTTVVLDRQLRPAAVNYGLATLQKLQRQIAAVEFR